MSTIVEKVDSVGNNAFTSTIQPSSFIIEMRSITHSASSYYLAGTSDEVIPVNRLGSIIKLSSTGALIWRRTLSGGNNIEFNKIIYTSDHAILAAGTADTNGRPQSFVAKLDTNGNVLWSNIYREGNFSSLNSIAESETGGYVAVGSVSNASFNSDEAILHISSSGALLNSHISSSFRGSQYRELAALDGGGYVAIGNANSFNIPPNVSFGTITLIDSAGEPYRTRSTFRFAGTLYLNGVHSENGKIWIQGYGSDSIAGNPKTFTQVFEADTNLDSVYWAYRYPSYSNGFSSTHKGIHKSENGQLVFASQHDSISQFSRIQLFRADSLGRYFCNESVQEVGLSPRVLFPAASNYRDSKHAHSGPTALVITPTTTVIASFSCDSSIGVACSVNARMSPIPDTLCLGQTIALLASDNAPNHRWLLNGQQFSIADTARFQASNTGSYEIQLISYDSICLDKTSKTVVVQQAAEVFVIPSELLVCPNERDDIRLYHSGVLSWNTALDVEVVDSVIHSVLLEVGTYTFYSSLSQSCRDSAILSVRAANQRDDLEEMDVEEVLSCDGVRLEAKLPGNLPSGIWPDGETKSAYSTVLNYSDSLFLEVLIPRDDLFCSSQIIKSVRTVALDVYLNLPNVITPNGDQINDRFEFLNTNEFAGCAELSIYNRWGVEVYSDKGHDLSWDGRSFSGKELNAGVYFYRLLLGDQELKGNVSLMR